MYTSFTKVWLSSLFFLFTTVNTKINVNRTLESLQYHLKALNEATGSHCLPIEEPSCLGLEYTHTYLPNIIGLTSQTESAKRIRDYGSLLKLGCSTYLEFFLCSVYFPMCTESMGEQVLLKPCASFCNHVRQRCTPLMLRFNFPWPEELDCSKLPTDEEMCIRPHSFESDTHLPLPSVFPTGETLRANDALVSLIRLHGELKNLQPAPPILTMKAIKAPVNRRRLLKVVNRVILSVMFVAGPLLLGTICDLWQYLDNAPGSIVPRLLKAVSIEMVGIGAAFVLWCNQKTCPILCPTHKAQKPLNAGNMVHFRAIAPTTEESVNLVPAAPLSRSQRTSATECSHLLLSHTNQNESTAVLSLTSQLHQPPVRRLVSPHNEAKLRSWLHDTLDDSPLTSTSYSSPSDGHPVTGFKQSPPRHIHL
ncbi:Frizzled-9 [Taenia solium]|eukprot:TsM_000698200 transcript=TsM_000698200 gene=TsM_000698200